MSDCEAAGTAPTRRPAKWADCLKSCFVLAALMLLLSPRALLAGAGVSVVAIFEPIAGENVPASAGREVAAAFHSEFRRLLDEHEVWGIDLLSLNAATSASKQHLGTSAPQWTGTYAPEWVALLNSNNMIIYAAVGTVQADGSSSSGLRAEYGLWDFSVNHQIAGLSASGATPAEVGRELGRQSVAALQLYFAEITEVGKGKALVNVGLEALTTGALLTAYSHGHVGPHSAGYPAHGHREEDDHLLSTHVYEAYKGTIPTTASIHSHSRSRWRSLLKNFPPALEFLPKSDAVTTSTVASPVPTPALKAPGLPSTATAPIDMTTTPTQEELRLLNLAHFHSGRPTGVLRVISFVKPHRYFNSYYAVTEIVEGTAFPGGFVRLKKE